MATAKKQAGSKVAKKRAGSKTASAKRITITNRLYAIVTALDKLAQNVYGLPAIYYTRASAKDAMRVYPTQYAGARVMRLDDVQGTIV